MIQFSSPQESKCRSSLLNFIGHIGHAWNIYWFQHEHYRFYNFSRNKNLISGAQFRDFQLFSLINYQWHSDLMRNSRLILKNFENYKGPWSVWLFVTPFELLTIKLIYRKTSVVDTFGTNEKCPLWRGCVLFCIRSVTVPKSFVIPHSIHIREYYIGVAQLIS